MARVKSEPGELSTLALIDLVIPEHSSDFRSGLSEAQQYSDLDPQNNYDKVKHWRLRTLKNLKKYLIDNNFKQPISDESITFFMNYIFGIYLQHEYNPQKPLGNFSYFINKNLNQYDRYPTIQSRWVATVISKNDMSVFFCLFLDVSKCLKENHLYRLSETQRRMIEDLKLQTEDLSLRESFERFVGIFFPKN